VGVATVAAGWLTTALRSGVTGAAAAGGLAVRHTVSLITYFTSVVAAELLHSVSSSGAVSSSCSEPSGTDTASKGETTRRPGQQQRRGERRQAADGMRAKQVTTMAGSTYLRLARLPSS
jgi:hypothetical protein